MKKFLLILGGLCLLCVGAYSLPREGIPYTRQRTAHFGPFEASAGTREKIGIPTPIGWSLALLGAGLLWIGAYSKGK